MNKIYMTVGISGSGKSKFANYFCKAIDGIEVNADEIRAEHFGDINYQGSDVWNIVEERTTSLLAGGYPVFLSNTNLHIKAFKDLLKKYCFNKIIVFVMKDSNDMELCWNRIQNDLTKKVNRSNVPTEVLEKQFNNFKNLIPQLENLSKENDNLTIKYVNTNFSID